MGRMAVTFFLVFYLIPHVLSETYPQVRASTGTYVGKRFRILDGLHEVDAYLGIPYAKPPIGSARYGRAELLGSSNRTINAQDFSNACIQIFVPVDLGTTGRKSEDCLNLNVWVPVSSKGKEEKKKTVMVWIYGGGFSIGSTDVKFYDGKVLAALGDVIVVSMNYRLGNLGFLNLGIKEANGNMGLHDQYLALLWVRNNIACFGGDPDSVVLFGESAGSISVSLHLLSPLSEGLFHRAILQSGVAYSGLFPQDEPKSLENGRMFARLLKCDHDDPYKILDCLQTKSPRELLRAEANLLLDYTVFFPRMGDDLIPHHPMHNLTRQRLHEAEIMIGNNIDEGYLLLTILDPFIFFTKAGNFVNKTTGYNLIKKVTSSLENIGSLEEILDVYFGPIKDENDFQGTRDAMQRFIGDYIFYCPTLFYLQSGTAPCNKIFYYVYSYPSIVRPEYRQSWINVTHGDELPFMFGYALVAEEDYPEEEKKFSKDLVKLWTSFAKFGYPKSDVHYYWPLYGTSQPYGLELNADRAGLRPNPSMEKCLNVWGPLYFHIPRTRSAAPWMRFK